VEATVEAIERIFVNNHWREPQLKAISQTGTRDYHSQWRWSMGANAPLKN